MKAEIKGKVREVKVLQEREDGKLLVRTVRQPIVRAWIDPPKKKATKKKASKKAAKK